MTQNSNDLIQSFRLHFWRESPSSWRGKFWHEQLGRGYGISVASPEQAFELIRRTLQSVPKSSDANPAQEFRSEFRSERVNPLLAVWRRIRRKQR